MFDKILVAVDSSPLSNKVFEEAVSFAKITGAHLILLHVISPYDDSYLSLVGVSYPNLHSENVEYYMRALNKLKEEGLKYLQQLCQKASELGVNVEFTQNIGDPGRTICEIARNCDANLIMMGRRGHSGLGELFLGSVSNYVLHHASCSVLAVQGQAITEITENSESEKVEETCIK
jgi:nucleotide-binding universal stress UspA family protein